MYVIDIVLPITKCYVGIVGIIRGRLHCASECPLGRVTPFGVGSGEGGMEPYTS